MNLECCNNFPAFLIFGEAEVLYDGRASSTLARGNYLIIKKQDGSLIIHGANHVPALNYISSNSTVRVEGNNIVATRRSEIIKIIIYSCDHLIPLNDWSENKVQVRKTEGELTAKIIADPAKYLGPGEYTAHRERSTLAGPVDLVLISTDIYIIEVKRKKVTLKDCYQVQRYLDAFDRLALVEKKNFKVEQDCKVIGCLAGPAISIDALNHCNENNIKYLQVLFEEETL